jgi:FixJ family two-component response regulator
MNAQPVVFIVDDDPTLVHALTRLLHFEGLTARGWTSARDFLEDHDPDIPGCIIADIVMPELSGLSLHSALAALGAQRPIVFISGHADIPMSVQAMKAGAVSFLTKPVRTVELLSAVREALAIDAAARAACSHRRTIERRLETLTPRERQVLELLGRGMLNKQIAGELGATEKTIKVHRARVMKKMQVRTVAGLVGLLTSMQRPPPLGGPGRHVARACRADFDGPSSGI